MSSTRYAPPGSPLSQERWASSPGPLAINANLVALRLENTAHRGIELSPEVVECIWAIQSLSHEDRGLDPLCEELIDRGRLGTSLMLELGCEPGRIYNREEVLRVRSKMPGEYSCEMKMDRVGYRDDFLLQGELSCDEARLIGNNEPHPTDPAWPRQKAEILARAAARPTSLPAAEFVEKCKSEATANLQAWLTEFCLNPVANQAPQYFADVFDSLRACLERRKARTYEGVVQTQVVRTLRAALGKARAAGRGITLMEGERSVGRSFAARSECAAQPGIFWFVETPTGNGIGELVKAILRAQGSSDSRAYKTEELKERMERITLAPGAPVLVFDHAQRLFPQTNLRRGHPERIEMILRLVQAGASVVFVADQQFHDAHAAVEKYLRWNSALLTDHIHGYEKFPAELTPDEIRRLASRMFPGVSDLALAAVAVAARGSGRGFALLKSIKTGAEYLAKRAGRKMNGADVRDAVLEASNASNGLLTALRTAGVKVPNPAPEETASEAPADAPPITRGQSATCAPTTKKLSRSTLAKGSTNRGNITALETVAGAD